MSFKFIFVKTKRNQQRTRSNHSDFKFICGQKNDHIWFWTNQNGCWVWMNYVLKTNSFLSSIVVDPILIGIPASRCCFVIIKLVKKSKVPSYTRLIISLIQFCSHRLCNVFIRQFWRVWNSQVYLEWGLWWNR